VYYANKVGEVIYILFYEGFSVGFPLASINEKQVRSVLSKPWMLDGAVEEMENYQVGVTAPPFHQWCRSVTVPYFDDNGSEGLRAPTANPFMFRRICCIKSGKKNLLQTAKII